MNWKEDDEALIGDLARFAAWVLTTLVICGTLIFAALVLPGCTENTFSLLSPSQVVTNAGNDANPTSEPTAPGGGAPEIPGSETTLTFQASLEGPALQSISITIGEPVTVFVIARDSSGQEIPSDNLTAKVRDESVAFVREVSERTVSFGGLKLGGTSATVTAAGVAKELPILVLEATP